MTSEIVEFLRARLDEDEQTAQATMTRLPGAGDWREAGMRVRDAGGHLVVGHSWPHEVEHIARHDPARVMRDVAATQRIVDIHEGNHECPSEDDNCGWWAEPCPTLRLLALPYAGHPDYQEAWKP